MASPLDLFVILVYLAVVLAVVIIVGRRENLEGFLVNNRKTRTALLVASSASTWIGAGALIGVAGAAYATGISFGVSSLVLSVSGLVLLAIIGPRIKAFGDKYKAHTIGDFFGTRFSRKARLLVSALTIVAFFIFTGAQFVGIASLGSVLVGLDFTTTLLASAVFVIAYAAIAGLKGDIYTDFIQFLVMIVAFFAALLPFGIFKLGLPANLPPGHFDLFAFAGPIFFFGSILLGGVYVMASMDWWQRIYASQSPRQTRKMFLWSALFVIPFYLLAIGLGLMAVSVLGPGIDPDSVLFRIIAEVLPDGLLGLGYAGILAAIMSSVDSTIVVSTASALKDFYKTIINPRAMDRHALLHARTFAVIFGLAGLATAYLLPDIVNLVILAAFVIVTFVPAMLAGMFWRGATAKGAFWGTLLGFIALLASLPFAFYVAWLPDLIVATAAIIAISKLTKHSKEGKIAKL
jgi:Na+/proline symporter